MLFPKVTTAQNDIALSYHTVRELYIFMLLPKVTTAQNDIALSYHTVRELYILAVIFVATIHYLGYIQCSVINPLICVAKSIHDKFMVELTQPSFANLE